jgi:ubiquinone/menaquinone biosynthesis C-methylase UbiE
MLNKLILKVKRKLGIQIKYKSETSKVRKFVLEYCQGLGCDIGFGGDKVKKTNCLGIDFEQPYAYTGLEKVDIPCKIGQERIPLADSYFDYVYTSHLIEDILDTKSIIEEFIRVLKSNGNLILVFPDQVKYELHCKKTNQPINQYHVHPNMGFDFMIDVLNTVQSISYELLYQNNCEIDYNVIIVIKIVKK